MTLEQLPGPGIAVIHLFLYLSKHFLFYYGVLQWRWQVQDAARHHQSLRKAKNERMDHLDLNDLSWQIGRTR